MTAERAKLMQFVYPAYYSSGVALFAPGGEIPGVSSWGDLAGKTLAVKEGNYVLDAAPQTPALQNVTLVQVPNIQGASLCTATAILPWWACFTPSNCMPPACLCCVMNVPLYDLLCASPNSCRPLLCHCLVHLADAAALVAAGDVDGYLE